MMDCDYGDRRRDAVAVRVMNHDVLRWALVCEITHGEMHRDAV